MQLAFHHIMNLPREIFWGIFMNARGNWIGVDEELALPLFPVCDQNDASMFAAKGVPLGKNLVHLWQKSFRFQENP